MPRSDLLYFICLASALHNSVCSRPCNNCHLRTYQVPLIPETVLEADVYERNLFLSTQYLSANGSNGSNASLVVVMSPAHGQPIPASTDNLTSDINTKSEWNTTLPDWDTLADTNSSADWNSTSSDSLLQDTPAASSPEADNHESGVLQQDQKSEGLLRSTRSISVMLCCIICICAVFIAPKHDKVSQRPTPRGFSNDGLLHVLVPGPCNAPKRSTALSPPVISSPGRKLEKVQGASADKPTSTDKAWGRAALADVFIKTHREEGTLPV